MPKLSEIATIYRDGRHFEPIYDYKPNSGLVSGYGYVRRCWSTMPPWHDNERCILITIIPGRCFVPRIVKSTCVYLPNTWRIVSQPSEYKRIFYKLDQIIGIYSDLDELYDKIMNIEMIDIPTDEETLDDVRYVPHRWWLERESERNYEDEQDAVQYIDQSCGLPGAKLYYETADDKITKIKFRCRNMKIEILLGWIAIHFSQWDHLFVDDHSVITWDVDYGYKEANDILADYGIDYRSNNGSWSYDDLYGLTNMFVLYAWSDYNNTIRQAINTLPQPIYEELEYYLIYDLALIKEKQEENLQKY